MKKIRKFSVVTFINSTTTPTTINVVADDFEVSEGNLIFYLNGDGVAYFRSHWTTFTSEEVNLASIALGEEHKEESGQRITVGDLKKFLNDADNSWEVDVQVDSQKTGKIILNPASNIRPWWITVMPRLMSKE